LYISLNHPTDTHTNTHTDSTDRITCVGCRNKGAFTTAIRLRLDVEQQSNGSLMLVVTMAAEAWNSPVTGLWARLYQNTTTKCKLCSSGSWVGGRADRRQLSDLYAATRRARRVSVWRRWLINDDAKRAAGPPPAAAADDDH